MNYTIITLGDPARKHYVDAIDKTLRDPWERRHIRPCNGNDPDSLYYYKNAWGLDINYPARKGQLGIWYSVLTVLNHLANDVVAPRMITFEDDAILHEDFLWEWQVRSESIPDDVDFFSLFLPRDQDYVYYGDEERYKVNEHVCRVYQRYGGVSMMYTPRGARKIIDILRRDGITGQYDDSLYLWAKAGALNGYTSLPSLPDLVYITGKEPSIVQNTDLYRGE